MSQVRSLLTLTFASRYCDRIFVIDNGSSDRTWDIVQALARQNPRIVAFEQCFLPYGDALRARVYNRFHHERSAADWWLILDADELLAEEPGPVITQAVGEGADLIWSWQIQFYFTEQDLADWASGVDGRERPITERRRYYSINWQEPRLFRNDPARPWNADANVKVPDGLTGCCTRRILNRHYQFRDPVQMASRLRLRFGHPSFSHHVPSPDWQVYVRDSRRLQRHEEGKPWQFSVAGRFNHWRRSLARRVRSSLRGVK
jgi:glycosyltransferase involved in cell wall biosynthesis